MRRMLLSGLLATGLWVLLIASCQAQVENQTPAAAAAPAPTTEAKEAGRGQGHAWMAQLTDVQRKQVQDKIKALKAANAKPEEIKAAIAELLKGFGLTPGEGKGKGAGKGKGEARGFMGKLTADQREQLLAKMQAMKAANAKPEEIKVAVAEMLKGWGIEAGPGAGAGEGQGREWLAKLTPEQREQVQAKIKELKAAGKTREEIKTAVAAMLKEWGIELGAGQGQGQGQGGPLKGILDQLTAEQRTQVQAKIKELKAAGKTREEIKAAVAEMLKGWGVEVGAGPGQGQGGPLKAIMEKLTPDQRQQTQAKVKELRDAGKTRQEIKAAVLEMLKGWGVEAPQ